MRPDTFTVTKLTDHVTDIREATGVSAFLVTGTQRALLIDTCTGLCGLRQIVEDLTDLPVTVWLTHSHGDHAGSIADFEDVWIHPADLPFLKGEKEGASGFGMRLGYANACVPGADYTAEDLVSDPPADRLYGMLADGMKLDLGGISAEVIHVPGHTAGSCVVLFAEERSCLFGDALNSNTLLCCPESVTIAEYRESLLRLQTFEDRFDTAYYSHGEAVGPTTTIEDNIELCDRILAGTDLGREIPAISGTGILAADKDEFFRRYDGKFGNIVYDRNRIR